MNERMTACPWYELRSESARNWLALGLLLAAWNFSDNDAARSQEEKPRRLQQHAFITPRMLRGQDK